MRSILKSLLLGLAMLAMGNAPASAQDFPTKPVTFIVPFPPGGAVDFTARPVAAALERVWKQPMVISNRPGASGGVGMIAGANARPDGYTLFFTHPSISTIPAAERDLRPAAQLRQIPVHAAGAHHGRSADRCRAGRFAVEDV